MMSHKPTTRYTLSGGIKWIMIVHHQKNKLLLSRAGLEKPQGYMKILPND